LLLLLHPLLLGPLQPYWARQGACDHCMERRYIFVLSTRVLGAVLGARCQGGGWRHREVTRLTSFRRQAAKCPGCLWSAMPASTSPGLG
jgi:hypothetical protein